MATKDITSPLHPDADRGRVIVEPRSGWQLPALGEVWEHRDLLFLLVRRDIAVRYRQSAIGALWAIVQPVALAVVFAVFLGLLAKVPSAKGIPYPVFAVSGMVMWLFFATAMSTASISTVESSALISKVYFPRLIIPIAAVIPPLVDFCVALVVVIGTMLIYGTEISLRIVMLPIPVMLAVMTALGIGLWMSALHVKYRDVQHLIPFATLVAMFMTPVMYPFSLIPANVQPLYAVNPMVGVLECYRWVLFAGFPFPGWVLLIPVLAGAALLVTGAFFFERMENTFADII